MKARFELRIRIIAGAFALAALLILVRLYFVQVVHGAQYREHAEAQYTAVRSATDDRGTIYFSDKDGRLVAAALMQAGYRIAINPTLLKDPEKVYVALNAITPIERARFMQSAAKEDDPHEDIAFRVSEEAGQAIRELAIPGVMVARERWRYYPGAERAAQTLGFVGFKGHDRVGRYGLERYWEETLRRDTKALYGNFFAELFSNVEDVVSAEVKETSGDVVTTIEPLVNQRLEEVLLKLQEKNPSKLSGGIIMDPHTGAVLAMAVLPTFDVNRFGEQKDPAIFANPHIENVYELGSIMKPITVAIGLDTGAIQTTTTFNDTGCIERSGAKVCNYDGRARGVVPVQEILSQSLNTGAAYVAERVGEVRFVRALRAFGLGEETGIDLPNEVQGILSGLESGSAVDLASASFGQGIAVTPIAMTRALAVLANRGVLPEPHVAHEVRYPTGLTKRTWHMGETRIISEEAAQGVTSMLVKVVDTALVNGDLKQPGYAIAAKTGTAQIAAKGAGYKEDAYLHSFFGYFPAYDPRFIVFLFTVEPQGAEYASQTLAHPFMDIAKFLISYYDMPPDR